MNDAGFSRSLRLLRPEEYRAVIAQRCRSDDRLFTVYAVGNQLDRARLGITVSRKVSVRSVYRNRLKRLVRESFRHHKQSLNGMDLVVVARKNASDTKRSEIDRSLVRHWMIVERKCTIH